MVLSLPKGQLGSASPAASDHHTLAPHRPLLLALLSPLKLHPYATLRDNSHGITSLHKTQGGGVSRVSAPAPVDPMFPSQWKPCKPSGIKGLLYSVHHTAGGGGAAFRQNLQRATFKRAHRS